MPNRPNNATNNIVMKRKSKRNRKQYKRRRDVHNIRL